jgi:tetratricopeptide (TPR) repeat protein
MVHFLYLGHLASPQYPDHSAALAHYLARVDDGAPPLVAWREAFGAEPAELAATLHAYLAGTELPLLRYPIEQFSWSDHVTLRPVQRPELLTQLGEVLLALGRESDAHGLLQRAAGLGPDSGRALAGLARTTHSAARRETLLARALQVSPDDGVVQGWAALDLVEGLEHDLEEKPDTAPDPGRFARAHVAADLCVALRPDLPLGYLVQSRLLRLGDQDPAQLIPVLEHAHALLPSHPSTALWLGELYAVTGRREQALRLLRKVQQLAHYEDLSARATLRIESLEGAP